VEQGGASQILAIADQAGIPLVSEQAELTPFQRIFILKEVQRQQEKAEQGGGHGGHGHGAGGNQRLNSKAPGTPSHGGGNTIQGETVEIINEGAKDDG
jgi:hypothetical protein